MTSVCNKDRIGEAKKGFGMSKALASLSPAPAWREQLALFSAFFQKTRQNRQRRLLALCSEAGKKHEIKWRRQDKLLPYTLIHLHFNFFVEVGGGSSSF